MVLFICFSFYMVAIGLFAPSMASTCNGQAKKFSINARADVDGNDNAPSGFVALDDLKDGDRVYHEKYGPIEIIALPELGAEYPMMRIRTGDGEELKVLATTGSKMARSNSAEVATVIKLAALSYLSEEEATLMGAIYALEVLKRRQISHSLYDKITKGRLSSALMGKWKKTYHPDNLKMESKYREVLDKSGSVNNEKEQVIKYLKDIKNEFGIDLAKWGVLYALAVNKEQQLNWFVLSKNPYKVVTAKRKDDIFNYHLKNIWRKGASLFVEEGRVHRQDPLESSHQSAKISSFFSEYVTTNDKEIYIVSAMVKETSKGSTKDSTFLALKEKLKTLGGKKGLKVHFLTEPYSVSRGSSLLRSRDLIAEIKNIASKIKVQGDEVEGRAIIIVYSGDISNAALEEMRKTYFIAGAKSVKVLALDE